MDETALDVLTRAATLVETDAANKLAGEGDKATVHPVDFSASIHSSGLNCPYDQLSGSRGLRLKRRPERKPVEVSKRCLTEKLQHVERSVNSKENVSSYDYLSDTDSEDQLSDEDTGKLVVDDNADDEIIENNDSNGVTKSPLSSSSSHFHPAVESVGEADEDSRGGVRMKAKDVLRLVMEPRRRGLDEERDEEEIGSRNDNPAVDEDATLEDEDSQMEGREEDEQEGPLDMTTNNRSRNGIGDNPPRWSPSTTPSPPVNLSAMFYSHPPRYNPYVSTAPPPPPYHALPQHHLSSRPHSASPPPYLPPYQASSNHFGDSNGHRGAHLRPAHTVQQHRPSVITCANTTSGRGSPPPPPLPSHHPPHHHHSQHHHKAQSLALNHHRNCSPNPVPNDLSSTNSGLGMINRRTLSDPTAGRINNSGSGNGGGSQYKSRRSSDHGRTGHRRELLSGMSDPVIDEHFRRSLGKDYPEYLSSSVTNKSSQNNYKSLPTVGSANSNPSANPSSTSSVSITGMSVDDHFAKALGETWLRLQSKGIPSSSSPASPSVTTGSSPSSKPPSPTISLGSGYVSNSMSPKSVSPSPAVQQRQSMVST